MWKQLVTVNCKLETVYRKATDTDIYINCESFTPNR